MKPNKQNTLCGQEEGSSKFSRGVLFSASLFGLLMSPLLAWSVEPVIAGLTPWQRPQGAPVLTVAPALGASALYGVSTPIPQSLDFLKNQGAWHTPFNHPGMTEPYDLRGWHSRSTATANVARASK